MGSMVESLLLLSAQAGVVAVMVGLVIAIVGRWLTPTARYTLWLLVAIRLVLPAPASRFSAYNLLHIAQPAPTPRTSLPQVSYSAGAVTHDPSFRIPFIIISPPAPSRAEAWDWLAGAWLTGAIASVALLLISIIWLTRRIRSDRLITDSAILSLLDECAASMRITRRVEIRETSTVQSPALTGLFRPMLLLPIGVAARLPREEMRFVILHELAHLKNHDIAIDRALSILQCLHWFNPAIYFTFSRLRAERELMRDAGVLRVCGNEDRLNYGRTLLQLARAPSSSLASGAVGIVEPKRDLRRRLSAIASPTTGTTTGFLLSLLLIIALCLTALTTAQTVAGPAFAPATTQSAMSAEAKFATTMPSLRLDHVPFEQAIATFAKQSGLDIEVDWEALEKVGILRTAPIRIRLHDMKASTMLRAIFDQAAMGKAVLDSAFVGNTLRVSTVGVIRKFTIVQRRYDISDFLNSVEDRDFVPAANSVIGPTRTVAHMERTEIADAIFNAIRGTVYTDSWSGPDASGDLRLEDNTLVVTQFAEAQEAVAGLLDKLREARSIRILFTSRAIRISAEANPHVVDTLPKPGTLGGSFLNDAGVGDLLARLKKDGQLTEIAAPKMLIWNGQFATARVGSETIYVSDVVKDKFGGAKTQSVQTGFAASFQATLSADRKYITMTLNPRMVDLLELRKVPAPSAPAAFAQLAVTANWELSQTVSVPDGGTVVLSLAGPTLLPEGQKPPENYRADRILLLVKAQYLPMPKEKK
jgi:beta-lactamase regulating signal transducer with metallopeptidase domain